MSLIYTVGGIVAIMMVFPLLFGITTVLERKGLGRLQNRLGPNRVGPFGFAQFMADGVKMLTKEDIVPRSADHVVHFIAPFVLLVPVFLSFSVIPFGRKLVLADFDAGLLFFFAVGAATELAVFMAGWSSRNKYSLLGAMRAIAQMISYEVPLVISSLTVVMLVGSLSLTDIVREQEPVRFGFLHTWHVFTPWGLAGFVLFLVAAAAESNRTPFDIPEAESEIIAGYLTEYSGFKYALFFLGEYLGLFSMCGLAITLFLGGWLPPFSFLDVVPGPIWFGLKLLAMIALFIWARGTLPRLRVDQLLSFAWKFMLPMALINFLVAALWHYSGTWDLQLGLPAGDGHFQVPGADYIIRWLLCAAPVLISFLLLARLFSRKFTPRVYRYAD